MLGKLLKYELKATSRLLLYMYAGLIVIALINMVTLPANLMKESGGATDGIMAIVSGFLMTIYVIMAIAILVVTILYFIVRFYKNQLGDEGYLMFTLPVSVDKHILSKLITAMIWSFASLLVLAISVLILLAKVQMYEDIFGAAMEALRIFAAAGGQPALWILGLLLVFLLSFLGGYTQYYAAMAIGPNLIKNRLGGSILAYVIIYVVYNVVSVVLLMLWFLPVFTGAYAENAVATLMEQSGVAMDSSAMMGQSITVTDPAIIANAMGSIQEINMVGLYTLGFCATLYIITIVPCYLVTRFMLKKKLNLA